MDGNQVRGYAGEVGAIREEVRAVAARLGAAGAQTWRSVAAQEFRARLEEQQRGLSAAVALLDDACSALEAHARTVDEVLAGPVGGLAAHAADLFRWLP